MATITPEILEEIKKAAEAYKHVRRQGINASVSFHEKLAVLSAGSLALAVSGAGIYTRSLSRTRY